jgi:osmotically-inducible protein OsmY
LAAGLSTTGCAAGVAVGAGATAVTATQKEKGVKAVLSDAEIRIEINHLWFQASEVIFTEINLQVQEGRVLLSGSVENPEHRLEAVRLAWQAEGVLEVINEIEVGDTSTVVDYTRDSAITVQLESKLLFDSEIRSINYSIETVNQIIYLMGIAQSQAELDRAIGHAKDIPYVLRVVNYVRLKDDPARQS